MSGFFLSMLFDLTNGSAKQRIDAVEAFSTSPTNPAAQRYRIMALCLFMTASMLLFAAALFDSLAGARFVGEIFGWSGIVCLQLCVLCGLRYAVINRMKANEARGTP